MLLPLVRRVRRRPGLAVVTGRLIDFVYGLPLSMNGMGINDDGSFEISVFFEHCSGNRSLRIMASSLANNYIVIDNSMGWEMWEIERIIFEKEDPSGSGEEEIRHYI